MRLKLIYLTHKLNAQGTYDRRWWWKHIGGPIYIPFLEWKLRHGH